MVLLDSQSFFLFNLSYHLYEVAKFVDSRMVVPRAWEERRMRSCCLMDTKLQFCKMKSPGDLLYNNMNILNATELKNS